MNELQAILVAAHYDWWVRHVQPSWKGSEAAHKGAFDISSAGYAAGYSHGFAEAEAGRTDVEVLAGLNAAHKAWWLTVWAQRNGRVPAHAEALARRYSRLGYEAGVAFGFAAQRRVTPGQPQEPRRAG